MEWFDIIHNILFVIAILVIVILVIVLTWYVFDSTQKMQKMRNWCESQNNIFENSKYCLIKEEGIYNRYEVKMINNTIILIK